MYKTLIVDDEKMIRMGMRKAIPWDSIGISSVFVAKSGREALAIIREHKPEVLITDIKMDEMTGLELIDQAKKFVPEIRVLVLTGYDDFEYARRCIKLNVQDFFLKPIDEKALMESVRKQVDYLESNKIDKLADVNENRARAVAEQMNIEKLLQNLVYNRSTNEQVDEFCAKYGYCTDQTVQVAVLPPALTLENGKSDEYYTALTIKNICIDLVDARNRGLTFIDEYGRIVIAFFLHDQKGCSTVEWLHELNSILGDEYGRPPKMAIGNPVASLRYLHLSYNDAVHLLEHENSEYDDIILAKGHRNRNYVFQEIFQEMKSAMSANIGDIERTLGIFDRFCLVADCYHLSDSAIRRCCYEMASSVFYDHLCHTGKEADDRLDALINSLMNLRGEEQLQLVRQFLNKLLDDKEDLQGYEIVNRAKRYIHEHLPDDLSVTGIASFLYVTPNYLSRLFKKTTGEGCNEYIVRKRIEKAKLLLETTQLQTFRIAEMVGYNDTNYFSLAVKKSTGVSPKKYRESFQKSRADRIQL